MIEQKIVSKRYYPELDGLRAIAILLVMWWHSSLLAHKIIPAQDKLSMAYMNVSHMGASGVCLFFVLSGFLITGILIDIEGRKDLFKYFFIRRILRIFPLYYMSLIIFSILCYFYIPEFDVWERIWVYVIYLQNLDYFFSDSLPFKYLKWSYFDHFWSLAVEEQFYIFWPTCFILMYRRLSFNKCLALMLVLFILSLSIRYIMTLGDVWQYAYTMTISRLDALIAGAILAYIMKKRCDLMPVLKKAANIAIPALPMITLFVGAILTGGELKFLMYTRYVILLEVICCFFIIVHVINRQKNINMFQRILCSRAMKNIAQVSYGMYVFHMPIFFILQYYLTVYTLWGYWPCHIVLYFGGGISTFILAWLSYNYFEKPILNLRNKYAPSHDVVNTVENQVERNGR